MESIPCTACGSVMGVVESTDRWTLYKCYSCRAIAGTLTSGLTEQEEADAKEEMDGRAWELMAEQREALAKAMTSAAKPEHSCSFCGKESRQVEWLIAGQRGAYICDECVALCTEIIRKKKAGG